MKNTAVAYILWIVGLHGFYLEKPSASFGVWFSLIASIVLMPFTLGFSILLFLFIWFADLFLIPSWIQEDYNKKLQREKELHESYLAMKELLSESEKARGEDA